MDLQFLDSIETLAHRLGTSMSTLFKITAIVVIALILINLIRRAINLFSFEVAKNSRDQAGSSKTDTDLHQPQLWGHLPRNKCL